MIWRECSPSKVGERVFGEFLLLDVALLDHLEFLLGVALQRAKLGLLGALLFEGGDLLFEFLELALHLAGLALGDLGDLLVEGHAQLGQVAVATLDVDEADHVGREVDDLLELLGLQLLLGQGAHEEVREPGPGAAQVPDVHHRRRQRDVAHAVTTDLVAGDFDATALTDDALETHALVLAARALPGLLGPEDLLAEQSVLLGTQGAVVDCLGLLHLTG